MTDTCPKCLRNILVTRPSPLHVGFLRRGRELVVQARLSVDALSCELWQYHGERETTVAMLRHHVRAHATDILREVNALNGSRFTRVHFDGEEEEPATDDGLNHP